MISVADEPGLALLTGRLYPATHRGVREGRPYLSIEFVCPGCRQQHAHRWSEAPAEYVPGTAIKRRSHCPELGRLFGRDVLIQADPADSLANARLVEDVNRRLERWKANRALREQQEAERDRQRGYARERAKWDRHGSAEPGALIVQRGRAVPRGGLVGGLGRPGWDSAI